MATPARSPSWSSRVADIAIGGTAGNDVLTGTPGGDTLNGGAGNDQLNGRAGSDVAVFSGPASSYRFGLDASGRITVRDMNAADGDDGTDTLNRIQIVRFSDRDIALAPLGTQGLTVVREASGNAGDPAMGRLSDGGFVVTWKEWDLTVGDPDIHAQRFDALGHAQGAECRVGTQTAGAQNNPVVAALAGGGFVIAWESPDADGAGIHAQRYSATGAALGGEFRVSTHTTGGQDDPVITALAGGGFVVTWQSQDQDGSVKGIYAQRYGASGVTLGGEFRVNSTTVHDQYNPAIAGLPGGGFVVSWASFLQDGNLWGLYAQRYDASGAATGKEFRVNTVTAGNQMEPAVSALSGGGFVVAWVEHGYTDTASLHAQRYSATGATLGAEFRVDTAAAGGRSLPVVLGLSDGGFLVSWDAYAASGSGSFAQRYSAIGVATGTEFRLDQGPENSWYGHTPSWPCPMAGFRSRSRASMAASSASTANATTVTTRRSAACG